MTFSNILSATFIISFATLVTVSDAARPNPYCNVELCDLREVARSEHTLCKFQPNKWNERNCGFVLKDLSYVRPADIKTIVDLHNELRRKVANGQESQGRSGGQPSASNMRELVWDEELATLAQTWANQCVDDHDQCADIPRFQVGQNEQVSFSYPNQAPKTLDWKKAIYSWYSEVKQSSRRDIESYNDATGIGHYTQIVYANTHKIGCGVITYKAANQKAYETNYFCNYGEGANLPGGKTYKIGAPGSACPKGTRNNKGLCSAI